MGHYAKINSDNIVEQVIVAEADFIETLPDKDSYIKTSYNTRQGKHYVPNENQDFSEESADQSKSLRKNYAGIGYTYDKTRDAFIPPKPFASSVLNETTCIWEPPVPLPSDASETILYLWDENAYQADNTKGWVLDD
jgi:hypothetical protein